MVKPVELRVAAAHDIELTVNYYLDIAGVDIATRFVDAIERSFDRLARQPQIGSLRFAFELGIPDLRTWPVQQFPYVIFYIEQEEPLDVWRVLHERRDIPSTLAT